MEERIEDYLPTFNGVKLITTESSDNIVKMLLTNTEEEVKEYIRSELTIDGKRLRFDMSGYDEAFVGENTVHNNFVLQRFAHLGIFDYTKYLTMDFYKGTPTLHFLYWDWKPEDDDLYDDYHEDSDKLSGYSTTEIIYDIFKLTIFSGRTKRRRI